MVPYTHPDVIAEQVNATARRPPVGGVVKTVYSSAMTSSRMIATSKPDTLGVGSSSATRCQARYPKPVVCWTGPAATNRSGPRPPCNCCRLGVERVVSDVDSFVVGPPDIGRVDPRDRRPATFGVALVEDLEQIALHEGVRRSVS